MLSNDEFAAALQKGLGRAFRYVQEHGLDSVHEIVLAACLRNDVYDTQTEPVRAPWLFQFFAGSPYHQPFRDAILAATTTETDWANLYQLWQLVKEMALHGDMEARELLKVQALEEAHEAPGDESLHARMWVDLEGIDGFLSLARIYGARLLSNPEDSVPNDLVFFRHKPEFKEALFGLTEGEPALRAYRDYLEQLGKFAERPTASREDAKQRRREEFRAQHPLESILDDARQGIGEYPGHYAAFGRHATPDELETVFDVLCRETSTPARLRLLGVFRRVPPPRLAPIFFDWAQTEDAEICSAVIAALAQVSDPRVHALARQKLAAGELLGGDSTVLSLFILNFDDSDAPAILQSLAGLKPDREDAHALGFSLRDVCKAHASPALGPALLWVYETTPCAICRDDVVELLTAWGQLPPAVREECQFDVYEGIRDFTKGLSET